MRATKTIFFISLLLLLSHWFHSYAQKPVFTDECKLSIALLDSANRAFFNFPKIAGDSIITILDIDGILAKCSINKIGNLKVNIIDTGKEVLRVRKEGILDAPSRNRLFVFAKKHFTKEGRKMTGFNIFYPHSGGIYSWALIEKNDRYYFEKSGMGWF